MKKLRMKCARTLALLVIATCFCACSNAQRRNDAKVSRLERKVLIVYLSRTNNTKAVAEFIHDEIGGTLVPLELENPYQAITALLSIRLLGRTRRVISLR